MLEPGTEHRNSNSLALDTSQGATGYVSVLTKHACILFETQLQQSGSWKAKGQKETDRLHLYFQILQGSFRATKELSH